jgi:hypothetical protein
MMRVEGINAIYDTYARQGLSNREIWRRYVYPTYGVSERTFYNILKAPTRMEERDARQLSISFDGF